MPREVFTRGSRGTYAPGLLDREPGPGHTSSPGRPLVTLRIRLVNAGTNSKRAARLALAYVASACHAGGWNAVDGVAVTTVPPLRTQTYGCVPDECQISSRTGCRTSVRRTSQTLMSLPSRTPGSDPPN